MKYNIKDFCLENKDGPVQYADAQRFVSSASDTPEARKYILQRMEEIADLYQHAAKNINNHKVLKDITDKVEKVEYKIQWAYGEEENRHHHNDWNTIPGCTCPYFENLELAGTGQRVYSPTCVIHGDLCE
jgi:hypothetical protein